MKISVKLINNTNKVTLYDKTMNDIVWFNQPWTKIEKNGVSTLDDGELLAVIFNSGIKGMNALYFANKVLQNINLHEFDSLSITELEKLTLSKPKTYQIMALGELFKRYNKLESKGYTRYINSPLDVFKIYKDELSNLKQEHFYVIYLNIKNKIIEKKLVYIGTLNKIQIHPREIFIHAIKNTANAIILVHNHPSGDSTPSSEDKEITRRLKHIGEILDIKVLDHIVIGYNKYSIVGE